MTIRAYLRASTKDQNALRAKDALTQFAEKQGTQVDCSYVENVSGTTLDRPELMHLLDDAHEGDVILVESIDRLTRLTGDDWDTLSGLIRSKRLRVVSVDLPTSWAALRVSDADEFTSRMLDAVNAMLLDMAAAIARKDYTQRRVRQAEGIAKAKQEGKYEGRQADAEMHKRIKSLLAAGEGLRATARIVGCAVSTVQRVKAAM